MAGFHRVLTNWHQSSLIFGTKVGFGEGWQWESSATVKSPNQSDLEWTAKLSAIELGWQELL